MADKQKIRIRLKAYDHEVVDSSARKIVETVTRELPGLMSGVSTLSVPLVVDIGIGKNWDEAH